MNSTEPCLLRLHETAGRLQTFRTAISLHSHTHFSRESLSFLPYYAKRIPVVARLVEARLTDYEQRHGRALDFQHAYWTPPASPEMVLASETSQIEDALGLAALVSITDHDSIAAGLLLQQQPATVSAPISLEWTIPFEGNLFHIGVHCLPPASATGIMQELARYTAEPREAILDDLFAHLASSPETLLIFNHPCSDFLKVGETRFDSSQRNFMARWRHHIHALEFNGMRPRRENQAVLDMAEAYGLPVIAGGDRHGLQPNTVLNLSEAETWGEFAAAIRQRLSCHILTTPAFEDPVLLRELATAGDALRYYPDHPEGRCKFTNRVYIDVWNSGTQPLSFYWEQDEARQPPWLDPITSIVVALGSSRFRPVLRRMLSWRGQRDDAKFSLRAVYQGEAALTAKPGSTQ